MSLRYRIALTIFLLEALLVTAILWQTLDSVNKNIEAEFAHSERVAMQFLANDGKIALVTKESHDFELLLETILKDPNIDSVFVAEPDGRVVASNKVDAIGNTVPEPTGLPFINSRRQEIVSGEQTIGSLVVWFSNARLAAALDTARSTGLYTAVVGMIGIAVIGLVIGIALTRRLEELAAAADRYTPGDVALEASLGGRDETARLARSFQAMVSRIQENVDALNSQLAETKRAQTALARSEARYRDLFEGARLGIQVADRTGKRVLVNKALATLLGYDSVDDLMRLERQGIIAPYDRSRTISIREVEDGDGNLPISYEIDALHKNGSTIPVQIFWRLMEWDGEPAIQHIFIDISKRKSAERALVEHNQTIRELQSDLSQAFRISAMGEVSSVIAHELHQPLTAIRSSADALKRDIAGPGDTDAILGELLPLISEQAARAGKVIHGIRSLFEGGETERFREDLHAIIDEACALIELEHGAAAIRYLINVQSGTEPVSVNRIQIQQVCYNLIRNALEATPEARNTEIEITTAFGDNGMVEVSIRDFGPGIPPEQIDKMFEPLVTSKERGMGMGLYTCKTIIEAHGGHIHAQNNDTGGAIFKFTVPLAQ